MRRPNLGVSSGRRRRRLGAGLALLVAVAVVIGVVLTNGSPSPSNAASNTGQAGSATVQRRDLVETDTEAGTLSYKNPQTVYNRLSGTITWLPSVGQEIKPGGTLYKIDGEPVILMSGRTPAYRILSPAASDGPDVLQLNRNLVDLGFNSDGIAIDDIWQPATTVGVELFQESLGESPTGSLALGQIVFLPGAQLIATVNGTLGSDGGGSGSGGGSGTGGSSGTGDSSANASVPVSATAAEFVSLTTAGCPSTTTPSSTTTDTSATSTPCQTTPPTTTTSTTSTSSTPTTPSKPPPTSRRKPPPPPPGNKPAGRGSSGSRRGVNRQLAALTELLKAEVAQLKAQHSSSSPHRHRHNSKPSGSGSNDKDDNGSGSGGGDSGGSGGGGGGSASAILQTTSTQLVVTVDLDASVQSEATVGEHVTVEMPAGSTVNGRITEVSPIAQTSNNSDNGGGSGASGGGPGGSSGSSSTVPVTITLAGHHSGAGLDEAAVSVNFEKAKANNVLSVPVTALLATSGGNYAVQEAAAPHQLIPVTTGLFAAGYVQISGAGIHPGLQVTDSQG